MCGGTEREFGDGSDKILVYENLAELNEQPIYPSFHERQRVAGEREEGVSGLVAQIHVLFDRSGLPKRGLHRTVYSQRGFGRPPGRPAGQGAHSQTRTDSQPLVQSDKGSGL